MDNKSGQCHRCEYPNAIANGAFHDTAYEDTPCVKCVLAESSLGTREFDENQADIKLENNAAPPLSEESKPFNERLIPVPVVLSLVSGLLSLPPETLTVLALRWQGWKYREIAKMQGISTAGVELCHKRAMKRWPMLGHLFPRKLSKQGRRRNRRKTSSLASKA